MTLADIARPRRWGLVLWAAILIGLPALVADRSSMPGGVAGEQKATMPAPGRAVSPPPPVEPVALVAVAPETARTINAAVPFSTARNPAARPFRFDGEPLARARAQDCLAAAQLYEAGDDWQGQRAVAQVVLNRLRHPAFPKSVCAVVFQGSERATGCQFTFTCDGALARTAAPDAWARARTLAAEMLDGTVDARVGHATHYHTDWVVPYWSASLDKITAVGTHLFFRWKGWWGTPAAFRGRATGIEPPVEKLAFLSPAHRPVPGEAGAPLLPMLPAAPDFSDVGRSAMTIGPARIGDRFGPGRLAALNSAGNAFVLLLDRGVDPIAYEALARQLCAGRRQCRVLGWTRANDTPNRFPIDTESLAAMSYAYIRAVDTGLERSLFNCREFPGQPASRCMRDRGQMPDPVPLPMPVPAPPTQIAPVRLP